MTDFDRDSLELNLPPSAGAADWDDVLDRYRAYRRGHRRRLAVIAALALVVVVGAAAALGTVREHVLDRGVVGLPPRGATPSTPQNGELVVAFRGHGGTKDFVQVYADGRMIWNHLGDLPQGANSLFTGLLEQRLTPEGVELMRSAVVSTGLVGHGQPPYGDGPSYSPLQVRDGDRMVPLTWPSERDVTWARDLAPLIERVTEPEAWLPASAWEDREIRAYVPSTYQVCWGSGEIGPIDPARILTLLPLSARSSLGGLELERHADYGSITDCADLMTAQARTLVGALDRAKVERWDTPYELAFLVGTRGFLRFNPYLPDGSEYVAGG
jgi:hypothetical protein